MEGSVKIVVATVAFVLAKMIPENMRLVFLATLSIAVRESSAIPLNCTVSSHPETAIEVQIATNSIFTCKISRQASNATIEVIQCITNLTDCLRDPGILIENYDINRTSTGTIVSIRNNSVELRMSCYYPYSNASSTHLELPNDCWRPNHTHTADKYDVNRTPTSTILNTTLTDDANGDAGATTTVVPSNLSPVAIFGIVLVVCIVGSWVGAGLVWMIRKRRLKSPASRRTSCRKKRTQNETLSSQNGCGSTSGSSGECKRPFLLAGKAQGNPDAACVVEIKGNGEEELDPQQADPEQGSHDSAHDHLNNANGTNECDVQSSLVKPEVTGSTPEEADNAKGTTSITDGVFILHARDDEQLARDIKTKIETELGSNDKQLIDVSADVGLGQGTLSYIEKVLIDYRWILFLETPNSQTDKIHLFNGHQIKVDDLDRLNNDDKPRIIPMLSNIKRTNLQRAWVRSLNPSDATEHGIKTFVKMIRGVR